MKILKTIGIILLSIILLLLIGAGIFFYKASKGINFYETQPHVMDKPLSDKAVLIFSKTNGFRHGEAIEYSLPVLTKLCARKGWSNYCTEDGGIFNEEQLALFDVVIFNNCTGKVLNEEQRKIFKKYILNGGGFIGIHGAGDFSHQWDWYENELIGAHFSHHSLNPQIQKATLNLERSNSNLIYFNKMKPTIQHSDEWYVFEDNPRDNGAFVLYTLDETGLNMDGSIPILAPDKNFGMGKDHPIIWYKTLGKGRSLYSGLGHNAAAFKNKDYLLILENAISWAGKFQKFGVPEMKNAAVQ